MASQSDGVRIFRISSQNFPPFDGGGAFRFGSRWVSPGSMVVHCAQTFSLAVLENLVHWQRSILPPNLQVTIAHIPDEIDQEELPANKMPRNTDNLSAFRKIGDEWYEQQDTAVLWVPSVVSAHESNILINQHHADFHRIHVLESKPVKPDSRLFSG